MLVCQDKHKEEHTCEGEVTEGTSTSGASTYYKCEKAWEEYQIFSDKLHADINSRYPGYNIPGSQPPSWFDESYAGERWDDDY